MVSNAAQLILKETEERGFDLYHLHEHVVIQINDDPSDHGDPGTGPPL